MMMKHDLDARFDGHIYENRPFSIDELHEVFPYFPL
jgi:hypothetical protein